MREPVQLPDIWISENTPAQGRGPCLRALAIDLFCQCRYSVNSRSWELYGLAASDRGIKPRW